MNRGLRRTAEDRGTDKLAPRQFPATGRLDFSAPGISPATPLAQSFLSLACRPGWRSSSLTSPECAHLVCQKQEHRDDRQNWQDQRGPERPVVRHAKLIGNDAPD